MDKISLLLVKIKIKPLNTNEYCVGLPRGAMGLSAVCDCGISWSYSLTILKL